MPDPRPHRREVAEAFGRAAHSYDSSAVVQREICRHLARLAAPYPLAAAVDGAIVDAGCGTGHMLPELAAAHPQRLLVALDLALPMLARCRERAAGQHLVAGDLHALPLAAGSVAGVWSSLSLQWCTPQRALDELARCLAPGGMAWLSTLGPDTFWEFGAAFAGIDDADHVLECRSAGHWAAAAREAGFELLVRDTRRFRARAGDLRQLMRGIKAIGAQGVGPGRRRALLGKGAWRTVVERFERFRDAEGLVGATYDGIFLILRKPA